MKLPIQFLILMGIFSFFSSRAQKSEKEISYEILTDAQKEKFRIELKRNESQPFDKEFVRTTDLAYSLISKYGFEAVKLINEDGSGDKLYLLGDFPQDCPWYQFNDLKMVPFLQNNFKPIAARIPDLLAAMQERCWFIFAEKRDDGWRLHYFLKMKLYDNRNYFRVYTGGAPNPDPLINEHLKKYQWEIPQDLKEFYQVHNGFGEMDDANFIVKNEDLRVMAEMMDPICAEQNHYPEGYFFRDLLEFFPDGAGNAQCFFRLKNNRYTTVDWDHETWEISEPVGFFEFINQLMSEIDEE
jgi:hypothetical protein